ncbi:YncE family protein [Corynebacterium sp. UMB8791]
MLENLTRAEKNPHMRTALIRLTSVRTKRKVALMLPIMAVALAVAACTPDVVDPNDAISMGSAQPVASPPSAHPDGQLLQFGTIVDVDQTNDLIGVRTPDALYVGTSAQFEENRVEEFKLEDACGEVSANAGQFAVGCEDFIAIINKEGLQKVATDHPVTVATVASDGSVLAGSDSAKSVWLYSNGELKKEFSVARETDQLQAVPVDGGADSVVRVNTFDTTIQDLDWGTGRQGATLRAGLGVGKVAAGEHGMVLAADATGNQLLVYTTNEVIRLQQSVPVPSGAWDVAWDSANKLAWVTSTERNLVTAYDISHGVPVERAQVSTVPDAQSIAALSDGTLIIGSASGSGLQIVSTESIEAK